MCSSDLPAPAKDAIELEAPVDYNLKRIARALEKDVDDLVVFVLDKLRHKELTADIRAAGVCIQLHTDGDVAGALMAVDPTSNVDVMMGTGGTPEGVLATCAIKALGGEILTRLDPQLEGEKQALQESGLDLKQILRVDDLVTSEDVFFAATGISGGTFLSGVRYAGHGASTFSLVLRGRTGTIRRIES